MTKKIHICKSCRKIIASTVPICSRCSLSKLQDIVSKSDESLVNTLYVMREEEAANENN